MYNDTLEALKKCPTSDANFSYLGVFLPLSYGIPTIILTIVLIKTILTNKSLKHVFFYQFILFGSGNCVYWMTAVLIDKILLLPTLCPVLVQWFGKPNILLKLLYWVYCYAISNYFFSALAIYAWRIVTIAQYTPSLPLHKHLKVMLLVQSLVPFSVVWAFVNVTVYYSFLAPGSPRVVFQNTGWPYIDAAIFTGVMFTFLLITIIFTSSIMLYRICNTKGFNDSRAERNIMITCLSFSVSAAAIALHQSAVYYFYVLAPNPMIRNQIYGYRAYVIDVASLLPTWCLLVTSTDVRERIFRPKTIIVQIVSSSRATV